MAAFHGGFDFFQVCGGLTYFEEVKTAVESCKNIVIFFDLAIYGYIVKSIDCNGNGVRSHFKDGAESVYFLQPFGKL